MTLRAVALATAAAVGIILATSGCTPQHDLDPNGRCLKWQLEVTAEVHPSATSTNPSWDLLFKDTSTAACVFGGVPSVGFVGTDTKSAAGVVDRQTSQEVAVPIGAGEVAYANIALDPTASATCKRAVVRFLRVTAPHVAGGGFVVKAPAHFVGCADKHTVAVVGQVTAKRDK